MKLLDRYILRNFLEAYLYCIAGFFSIWLVFDISDNISTFLDERLGLARVLNYYLTQIPQIFVILLPISLLLALLFCLSRMSRANEIVSMLAAGMSVPRVLMPLMLIGVITSLLVAGLNYSYAPHADQAHRAFIEEAHSRRDHKGVFGQIFRNRAENRTWFIQSFRPGANEFNHVHVIQQDEQDNIMRDYLVTRAVYHPETRTWELERTKVVDYDAAGNIQKSRFLATLEIKDWSETPFRLASANVHADSLSVPELREYLHYNADFPPVLLAPFTTHLQYRFALPWSCLVVALIAAPLGIGFSRRGILSNVAMAILLVFAMNFLTHLFLALGEGYRIPSWVAAWTPNIVFAIIGAYLLYLRAGNREAPRLRFARALSTAES